MKHHSHARVTLGGKLSAVLVAAGSSVGLGNIWRFPYVAGDNGGGAFLAIYILCVLLLGLPLMLLRANSHASPPAAEYEALFAGSSATRGGRSFTPD